MAIEALDVAAKSMSQHVWRHRSLELGVADQKDNWVENVLRHAQKLCKGLYMPIVLAKWILEPRFLAVDALGPLGRPLITEYPPLHILRLDDEYPVNRHKNVVDLGGCSSTGQNDVVDPSVNCLIEPHPHTKLDGFFTKPAFDCRDHGGTKPRIGQIEKAGLG